MEYTQREIEVLGTLAQETIEYLRNLPPPVVRVCGPLTTGVRTYEENANRLSAAEQILKSKGYTVFEFGPAEETIKDSGFSWQAIMDLFHKPVLKSGLIAEAFFLKHWDKSNGASIEHATCEEVGTVHISDFPEEWFAEAQ